MKTKLKTLMAIVALLLTATSVSGASKGKTLRSTVGRHFLIGCAMNTSQVAGLAPAEAEIAATQFNAVVAENCMKMSEIQPQEGHFVWEDADRLVDFAEKHDMSITGHCLVWHDFLPGWILKGRDGKEVSRKTLIERMHKHISTIVGRYKGRIFGWDVINEAFNDDGTLRQTPYLRIIGPEYFELAFRFAHEADPNAELYYNDYSMANPAKRAAVCKLVRDLKAKGCRIDAVGMQSHNGLDYPDLKQYEITIDSLAACGVKVMVTELDVNVLPSPQGFGGADINQNYELRKQLNPYADGLPKKAYKEFEKRYLDLFAIYRRHAHQIERVTFWGVTDTGSWLNNWPVQGRTNYPLLFDRDNKAKPVVKKIEKMFK